MIHGSSRRLLQSIAASFGGWGYRNRFLRSIMNVIATIVNHSNLVEVLEVQSTEKSAREREETVNISITFIIGPFHTISLLIM